MLKNAALTIAVGLVFGAALGLLAAVNIRVPSNADRQVTAFRGCIAGIAHPSQPSAQLRHDGVAAARATRLLRYQHDCVVKAGMQRS